MLQTSDGETEILLGNKQLLGIFFVVAILLGIAFAGGYKVGQSSKKAAYPAATVDQTATAASTGGETHPVAPEGPGASANTSSDNASSAAQAPAQSEPPPTAAPAPTHQTQAAPNAEDAKPPLGSAHAKTSKAATPEPEDTEAPGPPSPAPTHGAFTPQPGQTFLQVAAVGRDEAEGISDVLRKKGFRAHAVPKPGSTKLYRVIIGPMRDASDLSNTRTALRNTGFREIIVQKY